MMWFSLLATTFLMASAWPLSSLSFNPSAADMRVIPRSHSILQEQGPTNAKRFAKGLTVTPKLPRVRPALPNLVTPRVELSGLLSQLTEGSLHISVASDGTSLGYISNALNSFGEYGPATSGQNLKVKVDITAMGPISIATLNGQESDLPYMVGIAGFANDASGLHPGQWNYVYIGAGGETVMGSPPRTGDNSFTRATGNPEAIESVIFTLRPTLDVVPVWVNGDGSKVATFLGIYENVLFITGDQDSFTRTFGPATWVTMTFEPVFN
ncbi:hypothetical protein BDP27DRAFT_1318836 [Rhodocollybia butyracea]|uniref:Uncharacterized protein n=1 Tax=Rhodocollybia butyracea TaxID=206335 RepID=A0A9P5Q221_9AGAR|nr:hypothetical protein BDP27DRAFT_1318836 [Rhodocollybia butyracea]